jgi:Zn-dependent M28 family amino/carboxypeptidase
MDSIPKIVDAEKLYWHILKTEGEKHPIHSPERMEACADYILHEFERYGLKTNIHEFEVDGFDYTFRNIEATVDGSGPELVIVSHYDTVRHAPGANDNGTAIAVMLEVARVLSENQPNGAVRFLSVNLEELNPTRVEKIRENSLKFGITDEEGRYTSWHTELILTRYSELFSKYRVGLTSFTEIGKRAITELNVDLHSHERDYLNSLNDLNKEIDILNWPGRTALMGSSAWVRDAPKRNISVKGVLCLDTVGYTSSKTNSQHFPEGLDSDMFEIFMTDPSLTVGDFLTIIGDCNSGPLAEAFRFQCEHDDIKLPYACLQEDFTFEQAAQIMPDILRSDHAPFWKEKIPGLFFTDTANFRYPFYHSAADTIDKLDFDFLTKICKAVVATALKF